MRRAMIVWWLAAASAGSLASCSSTRLKTVWKDQAYRGRLAKVLIIGVTDNPATRRVFEDEFQKQLAQKETEAVASYTVLPLPEGGLDEDAVREQIDRLGADCVLVTRLIDKQTVQEYYPPQRGYSTPAPYYGGWNSYYQGGYERVSRPGYTVTYDLVMLETNIYAGGGEKLVFSAISETTMDGSSESVIRSFIRAMVESISAKGLI